MPIQLLYLAVIAAAPVVGILAFSRGRLPCPHCGRRSARTLESSTTNAALLLPGGMVYRCRACGGAMRYARGPTRKEYWEPVVESRAAG
jgi:phage terminase large subunit GpA-like protein